MAQQAQKTSDAGASTDASTARAAQDFARFANAWTEAYAEMWVGTSKVLNNLAADLIDTGLTKPFNRALRDTADVLRRTSDFFDKAAKTQDGEEKKGE